MRTLDLNVMPSGEKDTDMRKFSIITAVLNMMACAAALVDHNGTMAIFTGTVALAAFEHARFLGTQ